MRNDDNYPRLVSDPEADGLPQTADDESGASDEFNAAARIADGYDPAPLPHDSPEAIDRYGMTPEEARAGESLDYKLAREWSDRGGDEDPAPRRGDDADLGDDVTDRPDPDAGLADDTLIEADRSPVSMYDRPGLVPDSGQPVGRLVEPDEGLTEDTEKDMIARDAGAAGGGPSAEELAIHEVREP
jgi:hypothetical protein